MFTFTGDICCSFFVIHRRYSTNTSIVSWLLTLCVGSINFHGVHCNCIRIYTNAGFCLVRRRVNNMTLYTHKLLITRLVPDKGPLNGGCVHVFLCRFNSHFSRQTRSASSSFGPSPLPVLDENVWESVELVNFVCQLLFLSPSRLWTMPMSPHGHCVTTESMQLYTHTHPFNGPFPGLPGWAGTRKVKPIWILLEQETVSGSGISWTICKSAPRCRQITTPAPHHSVFLQTGCPSCRPTNSVQALKAKKHAVYSYSIHLYCYAVPPIPWAARGIVF